MKKKWLFFLPLLLVPLSGCSVVKSLEKNLEVNFLYKEEVIATSTVNQFTNALIPELASGYIPDGYELYGWTWYDPDIISIKDPNFESFYIPYDEVVHYDDVKNYAENGVVSLRPVFVDEDDIPIPDYYLAVGWYGKTSTSGLDQTIVDRWAETLYTYLRSEGATEEEIGKIHIEEFLGDVATAGSLVNKARYIDILIGFGNNINTTGGVEVIEKDGPYTMGNKDNRRICLLRETEVARKVYEWLKNGGTAALAG